MNSLYLSCIRSEAVTMKILFCVIHCIFLYNGKEKRQYTLQNIYENTKLQNICFVKAK